MPADPCTHTSDPCSAAGTHPQLGHSWQLLNFPGPQKLHLRNGLSMCAWCPRTNPKWLTLSQSCPFSPVESEMAADAWALVFTQDPWLRENIEFAVSKVDLQFRSLQAFLGPLGYSESRSSAAAHFWSLGTAPGSWPPRPAGQVQGLAKAGAKREADLWVFLRSVSPGIKELHGPSCCPPRSTTDLYDPSVKD